MGVVRILAPASVNSSTYFMELERRNDPSPFSCARNFAHKPLQVRFLVIFLFPSRLIILSIWKHDSTARLRRIRG